MHDSATQSVRFVPNECDDHAVEVEEEHDKMKAEFDEGFLPKSMSVSEVDWYAMVDLEYPTFLCTFNFRKISVASSRC